MRDDFLKHLSSLFSLRSKIILCILLLCCLAGLLVATVKFTLTRNYEGIFLLKGENGALLEVRDDLYLGEESRYITGIDLEQEKEFVKSLFETRAGPATPSLYYEWNEAEGEGLVRNYLPGGKQLLTAFSRFIDDDGRRVSGLIVGGGLPANVRDDNVVMKNETGMSYYDGTRWFHIWCNANEVISDSRFQGVFPSRWKFLGSRVLRHNGRKLVLESRHEINIDGVPLRMTRTATFEAGTTYFILSVRLKNTGDRPTTYYYLYGDEPWLGNYGTSGGNVGWTADGIYRYKGWLNTKKLHHAGLFDFGNDAIGEGHDFTFTANFIAWFGEAEPFVFFSNGPDDFPTANEKIVPLAGNARFIGVQWGPRTLRPGRAEAYTMAIGMAGHDPQTGFPVLPRIDLKKISSEIFSAPERLSRRGEAGRPRSSKAFSYRRSHNNMNT